MEGGLGGFTLVWMVVIEVPGPKPRSFAMGHVYGWVGDEEEDEASGVEYPVLE